MPSNGVRNHRVVQNVLTQTNQLRGIHQRDIGNIKETLADNNYLAEAFLSQGARNVFLGHAHRRANTNTNAEKKNNSRTEGSTTTEVTDPGFTIPSEQDLILPPRARNDYQLEDLVHLPDVQNLPFYEHRHEFIELLKEKKPVVVSGSTGSGKTSLATVLAYIACKQITDSENANVIITQPREKNVEEAGLRLADITQTPVGEFAGFASMRQEAMSEHAKIRSYTDGYLTAVGLDEICNENSILIVDEIHEGRIASDIVLARGKELLQKGNIAGLIVMSATLTIPALQTYLGESNSITVSKRQYDIKERSPAKDEFAGIVRAIEEGISPIVFCYGAGEIEQLAAKLQKYSDIAEITKLYRKASSEEKMRALALYDKPKIVLATNYAATGITVPGVTLAILTGKKRIHEYGYGISSYPIVDISQQDFYQQCGRVGRTETGYFEWYGDKDPSELIESNPSDISTAKLSKYILQCKEHGFELHALEMFGELNMSNYEHCQKDLQLLGMLGTSRHITELGSKTSRLPLAPEAALIVELVRREIETGNLRIYDKHILFHAASCAVLLDSDGFLTSHSKKWKQYTLGERDSDLLAEHLLFQHLLDHPECRAKVNIHKDSFDAIKNKLDIVLKRLELGSFDEIRLSDSFSKATWKSARQMLLQAIRKAFVTNIYMRADDSSTTAAHDRGMFKGVRKSDRQVRRLTRGSVISKDSELLLGTPVNIGFISEDNAVGSAALLGCAVTVDRNWLKNGSNFPKQLLNDRDIPDSVFNPKPKRKGRQKHGINKMFKKRGK